MSEKAAFVLGAWIAVASIIRGIKSDDDRVVCGSILVIVTGLVLWISIP